MTIFFSTILGWFSSIAGRYLVDAGLRFVATKALVYTFLVTGASDTYALKTPKVDRYKII